MRESSLHSIHSIILVHRLTYSNMTSRLALPILRRAARRSAAHVPAAATSSAAAAAPVAFALPTPLRQHQLHSMYSTAPPARMASSGDDSHSDFAPQRKSVEDDDAAAVQDMIRDHVTSNRIMLYMKGTPSMPMCGFSAKVVGILQAEGVDFSSVNVLDYPSVREGVKQYAQWPTIPQLYVGGEFIGGCDIVTSMSESGELTELLKEGGEEK